MRLQTYSGLILFASERQPINDKCQEGRQSELPSVAFTLAQIAAEELSITAHHQSISVEQWVIFPDSLHALISLRDQNADSHTGSSKPRLLSSFIARFKAATAKRINLVRNQPGAPVWQRSYKEQLIQDEITLSRLRKQVICAANVVASGGVSDKVETDKVETVG